MVDHFKTTEIYNMLGASELGFITRISADEWLKGGKANSIGKAIFDMELKIVSKDGKEVEPGEVGLLYCRSSAIFDGYWYNEAGTQEAFLDHEWATVGDMARMDNDGYYYLVDRAKDMIVSGGTNIYPAEVEGVILQMEGIADVGVIGVPDEKWGEQVKAVVVLKPSYSVREDEIISFCKERLAGFKVPKSVDYVDSIPRSLIGKMLKKDLRKKYWEGRDVLIS
jgi:long-chain acyl-CoA synthetase